MKTMKQSKNIAEKIETFSKKMRLKYQKKEEKRKNKLVKINILILLVYFF